MRNHLGYPLRAQCVCVCVSFRAIPTLSLSVDLDMLHISHAKKAQDLATETTYRTVLHDYTSLPTDMNVSWAKKAYDLQSDVSPPVRIQLKFVCV